MVNTLPIYLENYKLFHALSEWMEQGKEHRPHWTLSAWKTTMYMCRLSWVHDTQLMGLEQVATNPEEAVFRVLEEFLGWQVYDDKK